MLERGRSVSVRDQRLHQADRDPGVQRILSRQLAPPLSGLDAIAALGGLAGQALERARIVPGEARSRLLEPALELRCFREVEPAQKGPDILGCGALEMPGLDSDGERGDVGSDELGIEAEIASTEKHVVGAHLLTQSVQGLVEALAGAFLVGLGPEHAEEVVARHSVLARPAISASNASRRGCEAGPVRRVPVALDKQPAERIET